jgi:uncharacterized protein GlcG (DUF336 family)
VRFPGPDTLRRVAILATLLVPLLALAACGGGGGSGGGQSGAISLSAPAQVALTAADVGRIIAQAVAEAQARGAVGTIAVTDRVGNVLGVFAMTGAQPLVRLRANAGGVNVGLQNVEVPRATAAIAKAITGAYLSSSGNAFSTRTASMIVQESFPPGAIAAGLESGPLFGVQFSQLPCSDLSTRYASGALPGIGPRRSPLGLSADPGGLPLYRNGVVVGGIGAAMDADYGFDTNVQDVDTSVDELVAVAGTVGFAAPTDVRANRITVDGTSLRYLDRDTDALASNPSAAPAFAAIDGAVGQLVTVTGYFGQGAPPALLAGVAYGSEASGVRQARADEHANSSIFVLTDGTGGNRFAPRAGTDAATVGTPLTAVEVRRVLEEAFAIMSAARAQIRRPLDSRAQVTIAVVDTNGAALGLVRGPDAPVFGIDVSLQKARSAAFASSPRAATLLTGAGGDQAADVSATVAATRAFVNDANSLTGTVAYTARAIGNLARPYYPDGQLGTPNGPFSRPIAQFSPFATGLQESLIRQNIVQHVTFVAGGGGDTAARCSFLADAGGVVPAVNNLQNGLQIFPGAVPIYRGNQMVGAVGVSGDGIDQDDMIAFLGVHNAGTALATFTNAPVGIRSDQVIAGSGANAARLRYVACPFSPFVGSNEQNPCNGK